MNRKDITTQLSKLTEKYINPYNDSRIYWAREVTFNYGMPDQVRVDYMRFKPKNNCISGIEKGDFYCYEIKSCVDDFNSKNGHNFLGDYNYYVMTKDLFEQVKTKIPYDIGVLIPSDIICESLTSVKNAKRINRKYSVCEMLLMMFRSANRDRQTNEPIKPFDITNEAVCGGDIASFGSCPSCGYEVSSCMKYCLDCGQRLDWSINKSR